MGHAIMKGDDGAVAPAPAVEPAHEPPVEGREHAPDVSAPPPAPLDTQVEEV